MKNVLYFLKKLDNALTHSLLMCCAGLGFIILTERLLDTVMLVIGAAIAFIAVCLIAAWIFDSEREDMPRIFRHGSIIKASLLLAFGVAIMIVRSAVSGTVCTVLGILLSLYSLFKLSRPGRVILERNAAWYVEGAILIVMIVVGVVIAIYPWKPKLTAGIAMLLFGMKLGCDYVLKLIKKRRSVPPRVKKSSVRKVDYYTADFVDKSK